MGLRCECCGQVVPPRCVVCAVYVKVHRGAATHQTDHEVRLWPDGTCGQCGLPTKERHGRLGHVYDHTALIEEDAA
jgi:hypothetical protein